MSGKVSYTVEDVWGAACAAQRINGQYLKEAAYEKGVLTHQSNRTVMFDLLNRPSEITDADRAQGRECLQYLKNDLTFRALKGQLNNFDQAVSKAIAIEDVFVQSQDRYALAIVASLPASVERSRQRAKVTERMHDTTGGVFGQVGERVRRTVEVVASNYSQNFNVYWTRGITEKDEPVVFSFRESLPVGAKFTVVGNVKGHRDNETQLNRVKVQK